jgi:hypothetical protein
MCSLFPGPSTDLEHLSSYEELFPLMLHNKNVTVKMYMLLSRTRTEKAYTETLNEITRVI